MKKLIIQIPCYNEEKTLPAVIRDLPKKIKGIDVIETQVVDDGSTDNTRIVAKKLGVTHVIGFAHNQGLANVFKYGVDHALSQGADILVNTDGDNQYQGRDIAKLVQPILNHRADMVIGARPVENHPEFSQTKKLLQRLGSWLVRAIAKVDVTDATSGFRAYNRDSLLRLNIFSSFSYSLESIIQAGSSNLKIISVPIRINPQTRSSRLYRNLPQYLWKSGKTIIHIWLLYYSRYLFVSLALVLLLLAIGLVIRFLIRITYFGSTAATFWPTVVLAGVLLIISFQVILTGVIASLISSNRKLSEEILYRLKVKKNRPKTRKK